MEKAVIFCTYFLASQTGGKRKPKIMCKSNQQTMLCDIDLPTYIVFFCLLLTYTHTYNQKQNSCNVCVYVQCSLCPFTAIIKLHTNFYVFKGRNKWISFPAFLSFSRCLCTRKIRIKIHKCDFISTLLKLFLQFGAHTLTIHNTFKFHTK
jgi:hypothetical protein